MRVLIIRAVAMVMAVHMKIAMAMRRMTMKGRVKVCVYSQWNPFIYSVRNPCTPDDEPEMTEIWFTPTDETTIEDIFESMKHCQSLHPDENGRSSNGIEWISLMILPTVINQNWIICMNPTDSFSEEEDEFIMAEDNAAADVEAGQGGIRNLHIEGMDKHLPL